MFKGHVFPWPITNDTASCYSHVGILQNIVVIPLPLRVQPNWKRFNPKLPAMYLWCCQRWIHHPNRNVYNALEGQVWWRTPECIKFSIIDISPNIWRAIFQCDCVVLCYCTTKSAYGVLPSFWICRPLKGALLNQTDFQSMAVFHLSEVTK